MTRPGITPRFEPEAVSRLQRAEVLSEHIRAMERHKLSTGDVLDRLYWATPARLADLASVLGCSVASLHRRTAGRAAVLGCPACSRRTDQPVGSRMALHEALADVWACGCGWRGHRALVDLRAATGRAA